MPRMTQHKLTTHSDGHRSVAQCQPQARLPIFLVTLLVLVSPLQAREKYPPYVESLPVLQQRAYMEAAPSGQDATPYPSAELSTVPDAEIVVDETSRLEELANEKTGALSLKESQQSQVVASELKHFGYDIFNRAPSSLTSVDAIPVPQNYRIGPGDNIIVQLFGKRNVEYNFVVTRDGNILVPEYGPIQVVGLSFDEVQKIITEGFERRLIGAKAVVTMGQLRSVQVRLAGDVTQPGSYTLSGLSTLIDALLATGGIRSTGTLRNIELIRDGERIASLDLYDLLLRGHTEEDQYLAHNDTIFVPPIGPIVYIAGEIQRPGIYELNGEQNVGQVLDMAGGLLPAASLDDSHIERIRSVGSRTLVDFAAMREADDHREILNTNIQNGDFLRILPLEDQLEDVVLLSGHVKRPGGYQFRPGMRISDLLPSVETLLPGADVDFLLIKREETTTLRTQVVYASLLEAISNPGGEKDVALQARDQLVVFNLADPREQTVASIVKELEVQATDYRPARLVEVRGAIRFTGRLPLQENTRLLDILALAGGFNPGSELHYGIIARTMYPGREIQTRSFSIASALTNPDSAANTKIIPGDRVYVFDEEAKDRTSLIADELERLQQQASYGEDELLVSVLGEVLHPGMYPLEPGMRASDLLCAARGLTHKAFGVSAELSRVQHSTNADNSVTHIVLDSSALLTLCGQKRQSNLGQLAKAGNPEPDSLYSDDLINPVLEPMDQLTFTEKSGWVDVARVSLSGEFVHPGTYVVDRDETLCEVIQRAGGLTDDAYIFGATFTRRNVKELQQKTLDELQDQLDDLMVELSLSHSFNNNEKTSLEWQGKQDYLKTIRQLERAQATGRMVIDLSRIMKCENYQELVLQNGDSLSVPRTPDYVQVSGQVYVPTAHLFLKDRSIGDYVELSGGHTVLGRMKDTYVIQANGEVLNYKGKRRSSRIASRSVMPGARIYVPIDVDRMNATEKAQSWVSSLVQSAILAGIVL